MRDLRKLVLGETWTLPIGVAVALLVAGALRAASGAHGWWHEAGIGDQEDEVRVEPDLRTSALRSVLMR